jgi:hypothetical protein
MDHPPLANRGSPWIQHFSAELGGVEQAEQPAEGIVAGNAVFELEEAAQERRLGGGALLTLKGTIVAVDALNCQRESGSWRSSPKPIKALSPWPAKSCAARSTMPAANRPCVVSAWGCERRLVLAQIATDVKSDEITAQGNRVKE